MQRKFLFYLFFISIAVIFTARLAYIQLIRKEYKLMAQNNAIREEKVYPGRGFIFDRNGNLLVSNQSAYDIMVTPIQVKDIDTSYFCDLLGITKEDYIERLEKARVYSRYKASIFLKQVSKENYARINEKLHHFKGFYAQKRILREYKYKAASNVVGFIGEATDAFLLAHPEYKKGDLVGITGVEKSYEPSLKGVAGTEFKLVDVHNRVKGNFEEGEYDTLPVPGADVFTTIDIDLQKYGELLMAGKRGSVVAIEPSSGEILALVTSPSYDASLMIGRDRTRNYSKLYVDSINKPLFDRGLLAEYPPGSPFKVIQALVALQEGTITERTTFTCHHGFHYGRLHVACHCGTSYPLDLRTGISKSCNNYFCNVFKGIIEKYPTAQQGMDVWNKHVESFGLGNFLNNDLPTGRKGFVPDADYYNRAFGYTGWKAVSTISLGIGQGELLLTPIQMASMTATIANRGYYITPHIVKRVGQQSITDKQLTEKKYTTIAPEHFEKVIPGMLDVFEKGTARASRHDSITMCGKTGTAENPHGQDHSIFIAFAPMDNPKIALAIIVENGYWGSRWAAPIASLMIEEYITGKITRPQLEKRMFEGDLSAEYQNQLKILLEEKEARRAAREARAKQKELEQLEEQQE